MELMEALLTLKNAHGVDFIGVADITGLAAGTEGIGSDFVTSYPRALSIGIRLPGEIVDLLHDRGRYDHVLQYKLHAYDVINTRLDLFASIVGSEIQRAGFRAMPLPASKRINSENSSASLSHKITARLAGFGWIGKNCLLIHPEYGPRIRWTTVLTDAPLETNRTMLESRCGDCRVCTEQCPTGAILGRNFVLGEARELRIDVKKCEEYYAKTDGPGGIKVCGMCLYACPYGRKQK